MSVLTKLLVVQILLIAGWSASSSDVTIGPAMPCSILTLYWLSLPSSLPSTHPTPQPPRSPGPVGCSSSHPISSTDGSRPSSHLCPNGTLPPPLVPSDSHPYSYLQCAHFSKYVFFFVYGVTLVASSLVPRPHLRRKESGDIRLIPWPSL